MRTELIRNYNWLDWTRCIGIYLVILGHMAMPTGIINWIYAFHMPLFFIISGFLFNVDKYDNLLDFLKVKSKQLLLPYLLFNIITFFVWLAKIQIEPIEGINIGQQLVEIFYGGELRHNNPLWFLMAIFVVETIFYIFLSFKVNSLFITLIFFILGWLFIYVNRLVFYLDIAVVSVAFYALSFSCKRLIGRISDIKMSYVVILLVLLIPCSVILPLLNGRINMSSLNVGNSYLLFWLGALVGTTQLFFWGRFLSKLFKVNEIIKLISRNTIVVLSLHIPTLTLLKGLFMVLHIRVDYWRMQVVLSFMSLLLLIPVIMFINKYIPWLIGRESKKTPS